MAKTRNKIHPMVLSGAAASIHGTVTDTSGSPLDSIRIKIFDVSSGVFVLKTRTDSTRQYAFPVVNPGTYFVRADADETPYEDVWYVNSHELAGAAPVVVAESSDVAVNFMLSGEHAPSLEHHNVTGIVRDSSGIPIAGASVSLMKLSGDYGDDDDFFDDDSRHGGHHGDDDDSERHAVTDSAGAFHLVAHDGDYIVRAEDRDSSSSTGTASRRPQARVLVLRADTAGIDFAGPEDAPGSTAREHLLARSGAPTTWRRCAPRWSGS
jgi:protocatechuate 3,4-dioxygenase beta subunit